MRYTAQELGWIVETASLAHDHGFLGRIICYLKSPLILGKALYTGREFFMKNRRLGRNIGPSLNSRNARIGSRVRCLSSRAMQGQHGVILKIMGSDVEVEFQSGQKMSLPMKRFQLVVGTDPTQLVTRSPDNRYYVPPVPIVNEYENLDLSGFECRSCGSVFDKCANAADHVQAGCYGMGAARQQLLADADKRLLRSYVNSGGDPEKLKDMCPEDVQEWVADVEETNKEAAERPEKMRRKNGS